MLQISYPKHFVNMIEMVEQKNGAILLVEKEDGQGLQMYLSKKQKDVKLANFVVSSDEETVKLIDFGISVMVSRKSPSISCNAPTEITKIGGLENILSLKSCTDEELISLMSTMLSAFDILYLATNANPMMVLVNGLVALYLYLSVGLTHDAVLGLALAGFTFSSFFKEKDSFQLIAAAEKLFAKDKNPKYHFEAAMKNGISTGNFLFESYAMTQLSVCLALNGDNYVNLIPKLKKRQNWLLQIGSLFNADILEILINFVSDLTGVSTCNPKFSLPNARETKCLETLIPTMESILEYHKGEFEEALKYFEISEKFIDDEMGMTDFYEMKLYHTLTLIKLYKAKKDPNHLERVKKYLEEYKVYASLGKDILEQRYKLMEICYNSIEESDNLKIVNDLEEVLDQATKLGLIYNKKGSAGATVSVIQNGKFIYQNSFGLSDVRNEIKNTKKTRYFIASISKQFSCLAIALLQIEGKLDVTKPIKQYLPEFRFSNMTLLNLMQHTSGLRDYLLLATIRGEGGLYGFNREHAYDLIKKQRDLIFKTGESWEYTNSGYTLLEYVIEKVSRMSFSDFMKKRIFEPLGMKNTFVQTSFGDVIKNGAYGYDIGPEKEMIYAPLISENAGAAGGIIMDHEDLLKYDNNFYNNKLPGGQRLIDLVTTPGKFNNGTSHSYAWGLTIQKIWGLKSISHNGGFPGFASFFIRFPEKKMTIFVTANIADPEVYTKSFQVAEIYAKDNIKMNQKINLVDDLIFQKGLTSLPYSKYSLKDLDKYTGYYLQPETEAVQKLYIKDNMIHINLKNVAEIPLILTGRNHEFKIGNVGSKGRFFVKDNKITGMIFIDIPRARNLLWRKLPGKPICSN
eukprot:gene4950-8546_t